MIPEDEEAIHRRRAREHIEGDNMAADGETEYGDRVRVVVPALTLREYLTGCSLTGLLACGPELLACGPEEPDKPLSSVLAVELAVDLADRTIGELTGTEPIEIETGSGTLEVKPCVCSTRSAAEIAETFPAFAVQFCPWCGGSLGDRV